jgi:acyl-CoA synthetase (AMP-forming)/AMP-acid ligase II
MESLTQDSALKKECEMNEAFCPAEVRGDIPKDIDLRLWELFAKTAESHPTREAVISMWQPGPPEFRRRDSLADQNKGYLRWTYHELFNRSHSLSFSLRELGCRPQMRLAAILYNSAEWALFFWAAARIGVSFAPIDSRDAKAFRGQLKSLEAGIIVVQDRQGATAVDDEVDGWQKTPIRIQCSGKPLKGWHSLEHICRQQEYANTPTENGLIHQPPEEDAIALIVFTSGTSGDAKGCLHTSQNLISQTNNYDPNQDEQAVDRWLVHTPVSHIFAINNALRAWRLGDTVIFPSKNFDVDQTLRALTEEKCSVMSATPTLVKALVSHPSFPGAAGINLSIVSIAATMVRPRDIQMSRDKLGAKDSIQAYGMSEGAPLISWSRADKKLRNGFHPGVGRILPGAAVRICHPRSRELLSRNEVGELHVSGPSVISGYLREADNEPIYTDDSGRWLVTGDQGMMDDDGIVYILGRYKDIIIRGGENLNPTVLEEALNELPGVQVRIIYLAKRD